MLNRISDTFYRNARGWLIILLGALVVLMVVFVFPIVYALLNGDRGGVRALDTMIFAPPAVFEMIRNYGQYGREFYRKVELTADLVFPFLYLFFFGLFISWLFERGLASNSSARKLNVVPFGAFCFDLLENFTIVALLSIFPFQPEWMAWLLFAFTFLKFALLTLSTLLVIVGLVVAAGNRFKIQA